MSEDRSILYERALAQIRLIATSGMLDRDKISAILAILETVGMTEQIARYYREKAAKV